MRDASISPESIKKVITLGLTKCTPAKNQPFLSRRQHILFYALGTLAFLNCTPRVNKIFIRLYTPLTRLYKFRGSLFEIFEFVR